jgi:hypothetical protein
VRGERPIFDHQKIDYREEAEHTKNYEAECTKN